ncbi:MAG: hypothetical protein IJD93_03465 [Ruminococcus sp.]|nr:hypothetical protein [Ruminococcus sp.]
MKRMVYAVISLTSVIMLVMVLAGCCVTPDESKELKGLSFTQNHMNYSCCYSFYLRQEGEDVLLDAQFRFEEEPYEIILEGIKVDAECLKRLQKLDKEYGISEYVSSYRKKPSLFEVMDKTENKTTVHFDDGSYKRAESKDEHIEVLYAFFTDLAQEYKEYSVVGKVS